MQVPPPLDTLERKKLLIYVMNQDIRMFMFVWIIFRTPGGVFKKISDCCHHIHMVAYIIINNYEYPVNQDKK